MTRLPTARARSRVAGRSGGVPLTSLAPPIVLRVAVWSVCILIVATFLYALAWLLSKLTLIVLPVFGALLLGALLHRPAQYLRDHGWPRIVASLTCLFGGIAVIGGVGYFIADRISAQAPKLYGQLSQVGKQFGDVLKHIPGLQNTTLPDLSNQLQHWIDQHRTTIFSKAVTVGMVSIEAVTAIVVTLFLLYFFLAEGDRIWSWVVRLMPRGVQPDINGAGHRAWHVLAGWVGGTAVIATIHGVVIGFVLWMLGAPLVVPLAILVFIGSFVPMLGAFVAGGISVIVTLLSQGVVPALILFGVLVVENNLEGWILQPFIIGRAVQLHPVAMILVITGASVLAGLAGAVVAIPLVASLHAAVKYFTGIEDIDGNPLSDVDRMEPIPPPRSVAPKT